MFTSPQQSSRDGSLTSPQRKPSSSPPEVCSPLSLYLTMPGTFSPEPAAANPTPATEEGDTTDERLARRVNLRVGSSPSKHLGSAKMRLQMSVGSDRRSPMTRSSPGKTGQQLREVNMALTRRGSSAAGSPDTAPSAGRQRELTINIAGGATEAQEQQPHGGLLRRLEQLQQAPLPEAASSSTSTPLPGSIPAAARQSPSLLAVEQAAGGTTAPAPARTPPVSGGGITIVTGEPPSSQQPWSVARAPAPYRPHTRRPRLASQARAAESASPHAPREFVTLHVFVCWKFA